MKNWFRIMDHFVGIARKEHYPDAELAPDSVLRAAILGDLRRIGVVGMDEHGVLLFPEMTDEQTEALTTITKEE